MSSGYHAMAAYGYGLSPFSVPCIPVMDQLPAFTSPSTHGFTSGFVTPYAHSNAYHGQKPMGRIRDNEKERHRTEAINDAFLRLQHHIPHTPEQRLPRVKTIRLAVQYIRYLSDMLDQDDAARFDQKPNKAQLHKPSRRADFAQIAASEIQARNSYTERAAVIIKSKRVAPYSTKPARQRTSIKNEMRDLPPFKNVSNDDQ